MDPSTAAALVLLIGGAVTFSGDVLRWFGIRR
jgi:hypothetical protein